VALRDSLLPLKSLLLKPLPQMMGTTALKAVVKGLSLLCPVVPQLPLLHAKTPQAWQEKLPALAVDRLLLWGIKTRSVAPHLATLERCVQLMQPVKMSRTWQEKRLAAVVAQLLLWDIKTRNAVLPLKNFLNIVEAKLLTA
jgi:hypothetical protein